MNRRQFLATSATLSVAASSQGELPRTTRSDQLSNERAVEIATAAEEVLAGPARGPWRRLFLDATAAEQHESLTRTFQTAAKYSGNPVIRADKPWEAVSAITGPYVYADLFSYLPSGLDPAQPDLARFQKTGP